MMAHDSGDTHRQPKGHVMTTSTSPPSLTPLLTAMLNMSAFHREHEKFYSTSPREQSVVLQRHSRTLHALADQWTATPPDHPTVFSPYEGAPDLNAPVALQLDGVLFMEVENEPGEISHLKRDLRIFADDASGAGEWLACGDAIVMGHGDGAVRHRATRRPAR